MGGGRWDFKGIASGGRGRWPPKCVTARAYHRPLAGTAVLPLSCPAVRLRFLPSSAHAVIIIIVLAVARGPRAPLTAELSP
jgi:hypothetical protein